MKKNLIDFALGLGVLAIISIPLNFLGQVVKSLFPTAVSPDVVSYPVLAALSLVVVVVAVFLGIIGYQLILLVRTIGEAAREKFNQIRRWVLKDLGIG